MGLYDDNGNGIMIMITLKKLMMMRTNLKIAVYIDDTHQRSFLIGYYLIIMTIIITILVVILAHTVTQGNYLIILIQ